MTPDIPALPAPDTLIAAALYLMTSHARTGCPLVSHMIAQQLHYLAHHPSTSVTLQLRAACAKLAEQWENAYYVAVRNQALFPRENEAPTRFH